MDRLGWLRLIWSCSPVTHRESAAMAPPHSRFLFTVMSNSTEEPMFKTQAQSVHQWTTHHAGRTLFP